MINITLKKLFLRLFSGLAGGFIGMIFALVVLFLVSLARPTAAEIATSYSLMAILAMVFVGTLTSNIAMALFLSFLEPEKYQPRRTMLFQVFFFTIALFLFSIPFYFFTAATVTGTAGLHFIISALLAALICEIVSSPRSSLVGLLGILFAGCFVTGIFKILFTVLPNDSVLLIFALPLTWLCIPLSISLAESIHQSWSDIYGKSVLSLEEFEPSAAKR